jgi:glycosyltransferase involved in cell wall biosynthesis
MVVGEAIARGLPVISCPTGAIAELVMPDAGVLVPPGDVEQLAGVLADVIEHRETRLRLAAGARQVRNRLPTWDAASRRMAAALERAGRS